MQLSPGDLELVERQPVSLREVDEKMVGRLPQHAGISLTVAVSVLGNRGLAAWLGMTRIGQVKPGETVVVSAAAAAAGSIAGQIARLRGARVVGIAGGPTKCARLTDELGFDAAIDYKSQDVGTALDLYCPIVDVCL